MSDKSKVLNIALSDGGCLIELIFRNQNKYWIWMTQNDVCYF